ncbi:hypothetical protein ABTX24_07340 [Nocardioides sp. NPDC127514]|uniref:hypothetical protein n=1 Tax=unclassified Nocardioides TaxID=2615069 RepID=UPI00331D2A98
MPSSTDLLAPEYARWQARLAHEFLDGHAGQPVVMFVDCDELQRLADDTEDGPRSLAAAVRSLVNIQRRGAMFRRACLAEKLWRQGPRTSPPPTLPILALSVFAASEMRTDASGARHNYYTRLARAFLPDGADHEVEDLRLVLRQQGSLDLTTLWQGFDAWLSEQAGAFGTSTIREDPDLRRIGYPLSQTLVRRSDRAVLTRFFDRMNLTRAGVPGPDALLSLLKVWTHRRSHGFSERFVEALDETAMHVYLKPLIHGLAVAWDGKVVTAEGLRRLEIRLAIDLDEGKAWWVVPAVSDLPGDIVEGRVDGTPFTALLTPDDHSSLYAADDLPPVMPIALQHGFSARGSSCVAEYQPSKFLAFIESAHAGGWMSVDALEAYEEHVVAVTTDFASAVEQALGTAADTGWRKVADAIANNILSGYAIYFRVTFSDRDALTAAIRRLPGAAVGQIRLGTTVRPRLINGLPLFKRVSRNTYLAGGEPDLELPVGTEPRTVDVVLDGSPPQGIPASMFPFPFARLGPYEPGTHAIEADGETLPFYVSPGPDADWIPPGLGSLAWVDDQLREATGGSDVCGAMTAATDSSNKTILARRGALENWLVDHRGHVTELAEPPAPTCLEHASFMFFDVSPDRGAWLLQRRTTGWQAVRLRVAEPAFHELTDADRRVGLAAAHNVRLDDPIWKLYVAAWERHQ